MSINNYLRATTLVVKESPQAADHTRASIIRGGGALLNERMQGLFCVGCGRRFEDRSTDIFNEGRLCSYCRAKNNQQPRKELPMPPALTEEQLISFGDIAEKIPSHSASKTGHVSPVTLTRWHNEGVNENKLEAFKLPGGPGGKGTWYTSLEAMDRFLILNKEQAGLSEGKQIPAPGITRMGTNNPSEKAKKTGGSRVEFPVEEVGRIVSIKVDDAMRKLEEKVLEIATVVVDDASKKVADEVYSRARLSVQLEQAARRAFYHIEGRRFAEARAELTSVLAMVKKQDGG